MKTIIGRQEEKKRLLEYANSGRAEFVALYGRWRVGKTFLVNEGQYWSKTINTPLQNTWMGLAFERVCLVHIG